MSHSGWAASCLHGCKAGSTGLRVLWCSSSWYRKLYAAAVLAGVAQVQCSSGQSACNLQPHTHKHTLSAQALKMVTGTLTTALL